MTTIKNLYEGFPNINPQVFFFLINIYFKIIINIIENPLK